MSKLFTFYNREIEDSALITVWESPIESEYIAGWDGFERSFLKSDIDDKVEKGAYQIVENFRKQPSKTVEDVAKLVLERERKQGGIIWKLNNKKVSEDLFTITVKHSILDGKEFKSTQEAIEYLQALEKVFGSH